MKNPFIAMAVMAATMMAAMKENQLREFFGSKYQAFGGATSHRGHSGSKQPRHIAKSENRRHNKAARLARRLQRA